MQTFDQSVFALLKDGSIRSREAVRYADSRHEVHLRIAIAMPGTFSDADDLSLRA